MILPLLLGLTLAPLPRQPAPQPVALQAQGPAAQPRSQGVSRGCNHPKWLARNVISKQFSELAGYPLYEAYTRGVYWLGEQVVDDSSGARGEDGRDGGTTALVALAMLGTGSNVEAGMGVKPLRKCLRSLRGWQDEETGAIAEREQPEFLLDQALLTLVFSEAYFSDELPVQEAAARKLLDLLLDARGEDGLWHVGADPEGAVDPLVTSLAGYALFAAREARLEVPDEALERVFDWSAKAAERAAAMEDAPLGREDALLFAGALVARIFTAQALGRALADDEPLGHITARVAAAIPPAPEPGTEWTAPDRLRELDFAFFASLGLYQTDAVAWGRCSRWLAEMFVADVAKEGEDTGAFPAGDTGRFPPGRLGASALRILAMQSGVRELPLSVLVE